MSPSLVSTLGLALCLAPGVLHAVELVYPMLSRLIVNYVLPLFGPGMPKQGGGLSYNEQMQMLHAARAAGPKGKEAATDDYLFLMLFEQRQGAIAFLSVVAGTVYGLGLPLAERAPLHFVFAVLSALFMLVNANHAGIPGLGHHPLVSRHGRNVGIVFAPFWALSAVLNYLAFSQAGLPG